ncbi:GNAT family N-acetyltransferase [Marivibrio halodurans]|uniref:GNAT family N-acetyltransferase n=1 Tax=Marivibrio halodurans TaxID=2039722 RepID=A0A8J7RZY1_9PROT|nr:GNAT family N-acetyltransferase [Marivibrio halodurans]
MTEGAPELVLETARLRLRPLTVADLDLCIALGTDPAVMRFIGPVETAETITAQMSDLTRRCAQGRIGIWVILDRSRGEKLGTVFLLPLPVEEKDTPFGKIEGDDLPEGEIEIGYWIKPAAWGRGIATEACARLLRFAFEATALDEVAAVIDPDNAASRRVLLKAGMRETGIRRAFAQDCPGFRMARAEWVAREAGDA